MTLCVCPSAVAVRARIGHPKEETKTDIKGSLTDMCQLKDL